MFAFGQSSKQICRECPYRKSWAIPIVTSEQKGLMVWKSQIPALAFHHQLKIHLWNFEIPDICLRNITLVSLIMSKGLCK